MLRVDFSKGVISPAVADLYLSNSCGETKMSGVVAYFLILGGATGIAVALLFGLRAVKLL